MNSVIQNINTRNNSDLFQPLSHLTINSDFFQPLSHWTINSDFFQPLSHWTIHQKGPFSIGVKVHNSLTPVIKDLSHNIKKLKSPLRGFLQQHSFYKMEEYFSYKAVVRQILTAKLIFIILSRTKL